MSLAFCDERPGADLHATLNYGCRGGGDTPLHSRLNAQRVVDIKRGDTRAVVRIKNYVLACV